jgi:hypothetical protein
MTHTYQSLIKKTVFIYLLLALFPINVFITDSSSVSVIPLAFLLINVFIYLLKGRFLLFNLRDRDVLVVVAMVVYSILSSIIGVLIFLEEWKSIILSLAASIMLVSLFFVSKNMTLYWSFDQIIKITIYGSSILLLYLFINHIFSPQFNIKGVGGRVLNQRDGLYMSYICIFSLWGIFHSKEGVIAKKVFFATFFGSTFYMVFSYSIGAYLLLVIISSSLLFVYIRNLKLIVVFLIVILISAFLFFQFNDSSEVIFRFNRFFNIIEDIELDHSAFERWLIWNWIGEYLLNHPLALLFGTGNSIDAFNITLQIHDTHENILTTESMYLDILLRMGVIGLLLQFYVFIRMVKLIKLNKTYFNSEYLAVYFIIFIISVIVFNIYEPSLRDRSFTMFFYFLYGYLSNLQTKTKVNCKEL